MRNFSCQSVRVYKSKINFSPSPDEDIVKLFEQSGVRYQSGRHSVYISDSKDIGRLCDGLDGRYPEPWGLKITKSREMADDGSPYYTSRRLAPASSFWSMRAVGSVAEKVVVSNILNSYGVAPRVYDLICLEDSDGNRHYGSVVEHIQGDVVHGAQGEKFIHNFKSVLKSLGMSTVSIAEHCDLRPPVFRDNIVSNADKIFYVDIQNFIFKKRQFIQRLEKELAEKYRSDLLSSQVLLEQTQSRDKEVQIVPALRDSINGLFDKYGLAVDNMLIFDACSDVGIGGACALSLGARWVVLLRQYEQEPRLGNYWFLRGFSRFSVMNDVDSVWDNNYLVDSIENGFGVLCDSINSDVSSLIRDKGCKFVIKMRIGSEQMDERNSELEQCADQLTSIETVVLDRQLKSRAISLSLYVNAQ